MSSFQGLTLNGKYYSKQWILQNYRHLSSERFIEHELRTLKFCGRWLSGAKEFVVHTSGSTGEPKPIRLKRAQMALSARMTGKALNLKKGDRALVCLSSAYIGGMMMLVRGFELGLDLTIVEPSGNPFESLKLEFESSHHFDFTALVPLQLQAILSSGLTYVSLLNKMKAILVGGAPVSIALLKRLQVVESPIYETFGMTETASHIALRRLNGAEAMEAFRVLPTVVIGKDERGCLTIKSPLTNNQPIVTNDLVEIESQRMFKWLGRIDHVINTGGVKVQAEKVEKALEEALFEIHGGNYVIREFFVAPWPDENYGQVVAAIFEGPEFPPETKNGLLERLSNKLKKYEIPKHFCFVDSLVRTSNGKIDRSENLNLLIRLQLKR